MFSFSQCSVVKVYCSDPSLRPQKHVYTEHCKEWWRSLRSSAFSFLWWWEAVGSEVLTNRSMAILPGLDRLEADAAQASPNSLCSLVHVGSQPTDGGVSWAKGQRGKNHRPPSFNLLNNRDDITWWGSSKSRSLTFKMWLFKGKVNLNIWKSFLKINYFLTETLNGNVFGNCSITDT